MKLDKDNWKALIGTILFHGLLVVALMFLALRTPLPLPGEQGVEVSLGNSTLGMGKRVMHTKPETMKPKPLHKTIVQSHQPNPKLQPKSVVSKQKNLTQNIEKAPALPPVKKTPTKKKKKKSLTQQRVKKKTHVPKTMKTDSAAMAHNTPATKNPQHVVNQHALFKLSSESQNQGKGILPGKGNEGKPHGFKESNRYNGQGGQGQGISFSLGSRGAKFLAKPPTKFSEQGTVVVRIEVNPQGHVIRASVFAKGTTIVSENMRKLAVASAKKSVFSADPTAPTIQIGTITYHFILKR